MTCMAGTLIGLQKLVVEIATDSLAGVGRWGAPLFLRAGVWFGVDYVAG